MSYTICHSIKYLKKKKKKKLYKKQNLEQKGLEWFEILQHLQYRILFSSMSANGEA